MGTIYDIEACTLVGQLGLWDPNMPDRPKAGYEEMKDSLLAEAGAGQLLLIEQGRPALERARRSHSQLESDR